MKKIQLTLIYTLSIFLIYANDVKITLPYVAEKADIEKPGLWIQNEWQKIKIKLTGNYSVFDAESIYDEGKIKILLNDEPYITELKENYIVLDFNLENKANFIIEDGTGRVIGNTTVNPLPLWMSIFPPLLAIVFALLFKEVLTALFLGIFSGAAIMGVYANGWTGIFTGLLDVVQIYIVDALNNKDHISVIVFSMLIGGVVAIISKNGGMQGVVNKITRWANNARNGQLVTYILGIAIFFDDYANTLVVGNTMRPITDRLKISREKLAYIVDSTAAPVAAIAFVTTWIGAELGYIQSGINDITAQSGVENMSAYGVFLNSLAYSFYPILTLIFMFLIIWQSKDFGPMYKAEYHARNSGIVAAQQITHDDNNNQVTDELEELNPINNIKHKAYNAVIPILTIISITLIGLYITGKNNTNDLLLADKNFFQKLSVIIGNADSYKSLLWASLSGIMITIILTLGQRIMTLQQTMETAVKGFKTMLNAILILILAWSLAQITENMHTADFITQSLNNNLPPWLIPAFTFIIAAIVAFSTGTSWGTMAILYPLMLPASWSICTAAGYNIVDTQMIFYNTVSCVLSGAVLGDHCSPISDTTILSSLASSCNHINHVKTQMPYSLAVGAVSIFAGTIPAAMGVNSLIIFPVCVLILFLIVKYAGKKI